MVNGRHKGTRGELQVAAIMNVWWKAYESTVQFIRTPLSGGWQHGAPNIAAHFKACGDLMTTSSTFPFCVEVKWRENWSVGSFLDGRYCPVWQWWAQACAAADRQNNVPMMFMRRNRIPGSREPFPWIVLVPRTFVRARVLDAPDMNWEIRKMRTRGVDIDVEPAGYDYRRFLAMAPIRMLNRAPMKVRGGKIA